MSEHLPHHVVTVHLVVAAETTKYDANGVADGISALLGDAEGSGFLADWGYAAIPEKAIPIPSENYAEGDFYGLAKLPNVGAWHPSADCTCVTCRAAAGQTVAGVSDVAERLIAWVSDAAFECGEWDSDDENHTYEELHGESLKAQTKLREFIADLEARAAATTLTARDLVAIQAGLEVGRGVDEEEPWPGLDDAIAKITTMVDALPREKTEGDAADLFRYVADGAVDTSDEVDDTNGVLGALNSQYEPEHEAPSVDAMGHA